MIITFYSAFSYTILAYINPPHQLIVFYSVTCSLPFSELAQHFLTPKPLFVVCICKVHHTAHSLGCSLVCGFLDGSDGKESACNARDLDSIPGPGRSAGEGHGNPLQCSCLENSLDKGTWQATVCWVANSWT